MYTPRARKTDRSAAEEGSGHGQGSRQTRVCCQVTAGLARAQSNRLLPLWFFPPRNQGTDLAALLRGNSFLKPGSSYQQLSCPPPLAAVGVPPPGPQIQGGLELQPVLSQVSWLLACRPDPEAESFFPTTTPSPHNYKGSKVPLVP